MKTLKRFVAFRNFKIHNDLIYYRNVYRFF